MKTDKLFGKWRSSKIIWKDKSELNYTDADNWTEYTIGKDGLLSSVYHNKGVLHTTGDMQKWEIVNGEIIIYNFGKQWFKVVALSDTDLKLKMLSSDSFFHYKKV